MAKLKDLSKQFERELGAFFDQKAGRAATLEELEALKREFKAEHLPQGQAAIVMAKQSKLLRPRTRYVSGIGDVLVGTDKRVGELKEMKALLLKAGLAHHGPYGEFTMNWLRGRKVTWADVLAQDPSVVKEAFGIPKSADPAQTVSRICESLVARSFDYEFDSATLEKRVGDYQAMLRKRGYHAVLDAADKPGVTLSDLKASADKALTPAKPTLPEMEAWNETHTDRLLEGVEHEQAIAAADETVREQQLGGLDI